MQLVLGRSGSKWLSLMLPGEGQNTASSGAKELRTAEYNTPWKGGRCAQL